MALIERDDRVLPWDERLERVATLRALHPLAYACLDASVHAELDAYLAAQARLAADIAARRTRP
jgi:hypothetical protein